MKFLLDTHTFIWWDNQPSKLSERVLKLCEDPSNRLFLSDVSIWEIQIKHQLGKLSLNAPLQSIIDNQIRQNGVDILPIKTEHILNLSALEHHHRDPFDRLLISQAQIETLTMLSKDAAFTAYNVPQIW